MKKLIAKIAFAATLLMPLAFALPAQAIAPTWNVTGTYVVAFKLDPDTVTIYSHDAFLTQDAFGNVTGNGGYPVAGPYAYSWHITSGSISGNQVNFTILYDTGATGTVMHMTGTVAADGTMSGLWDDNFGGARTGTWATTSGTASSIPCLESTGGKGLGYWTNKNGQALETAGDFTALTALNLRTSSGANQDFSGTLTTNKTNLNTWLLGANATNMAYMLSAQLTAVELSVLHNFTNGSALVSVPTSVDPSGMMTVNALMSAANVSLGANAVTTSGNPARSSQEALKNALEKVASGQNIQICRLTFTATDSLYYNGATNSAPLYGTGPITFTWNPSTGGVTSGLYEEIVPATTGTHYFNNVVSGTVSGGAVSLTFLRTVPNAYGPFTFSGTLVGNTLTGTLDGPYYFTATGTITP